MVYKNKNEELHSPEMAEGTQERGIAPGVQLTRARVEAVFVRRQNMLSAVEADIEVRFYEAIRRKIDYENAFLLGIVEADLLELEAKKRTNTILNPQYFIHKPLDTRYFLLP